MSGDPHYVPEHERADEAVRDGILEEDNPIPAWWWWTFIGTVIFAIGYVPYYTFSGWSQEVQYAAEVEAAEVVAAAHRATLPSTNPYQGDATILAEGEQIFVSICAVCHKPDGSGLVGPSLVDPYWKYGDSDEELYVSVAQGRPLGMPPWETQLGSDKIWKVLAYMQSLPRTQEPGMGSPEFEAAAAPGS